MALLFFYFPVEHHRYNPIYMKFDKKALFDKAFHLKVLSKTFKKAIKAMLIIVGHYWPSDDDSQHIETWKLGSTANIYFLMKYYT